MPQKATWSRLFDEMARLGMQDAMRPLPPGQPNLLTQFRRQKIAEVEKVTQRPLIVYATACTTMKGPLPIEALMIDYSDKIGFKAVTERIEPPNLDVLIHSPGGVPDATESIVQQLRAKFSNIRFIVPSFAKSAATMLAMSGNEIIMDRDAELGPIDPQMRTQTGMSPAEAIREQFKRIQQEIQKDGSKLAGYVPILAQYGPSLLVDAEHATERSKKMVSDWLKTYMLANEPDANATADRICNFLCDHERFKTHGYAIRIGDLLPLGVKVTDLRSDPALYQAVDEVYCVLDILLSVSPVYKIFEGTSEGVMRQVQMQVIQAMPRPMVHVPPQPPQQQPTQQQPAMVPQQPSSTEAAPPPAAPDASD